MGLDWNPMSRAKHGHEAELAELVALDWNDLAPDRLSEVRARYHEISEPPFATMGAPRVGFDAAADAWLEQELRANGQEAEIERAKEEMNGFYVLSLLPPCAGLPIYTSRGYEGVDRYTFRGEFLDDVQEILGETLFERAWDRMSAEELSKYAAELLACARRYAAEHGVEQLEQQYEPPEDSEEGSPASKAHILFSAAAWCSWWSARGHGLEPYY